MIALILLRLMTLAMPIQAGQVKIEFMGLRSDKGSLAISIFSEEGRDGFPGNGAVAIKTYYKNLKDEDALHLVEELPDGIYAISVLHDEDSDKELRTNFLGIPQEGFGFSMNPTTLIGAPSFWRAQFDTRKTKEIQIRMKYF